MSTYSLPQRDLNSPLEIGVLSLDGRSGLPNSLREALLQCGKGEASLLLDVLFEAGFAIGKRFTVKNVFGKLCEIGSTLAEGLVRRALNSGLFKYVTLQNRRRGRPERQYTMPDPIKLVKQYAKGTFVAADALTSDDKQSLKHYRQALHRELIRRAPGVYSRQFLAQRLGIGKRTTCNYDQRVGVHAIRRLRETNLRYIMNWRDMVILGKAGLNWLRVRYTDGRYFDAPLKTGIAERHMWKKGIEGVYLVTQLCNRYVFSLDADWLDTLFLRQNDDIRAFARSSDPFGFHKERMPSDPISATLMVDPKAYKPKSDPIPDWLPPEMAARRISTNPFAAPRSSTSG